MVGHKTKWLVLGMAFLATVINYLDRQTLSVMAPILLAKFQISAQVYSEIIFAFMFAYTVMNGVSGRLLDRLGSRVGYGLTIAWWSVAEVLHAFSAGAFSLGFFRFLLGLGEAGNYPAGVKLIAEWFPPEERSLASGIFNSGAAVGAIFAPPLVAWILLRAGWRITFIVIGSLGFIWLAIWIVSYRKKPAVSEEPATIPLRTLVRSRFLWQFTLSKVFSDPVWYFYTFWVPQYLKVVHNFSIAQIGQTAWVPFLTAGIGNLAGGALFRGFLSFGTTVATTRRFCVVVFSTLMMVAVFVGGSRNPATCLALISVCTFGYCGALANLLAIPADVFPKRAVASVWGFASMGSGFGAMIFSLATGWLVDRYSFQPVFWLFGLLPIISAWIVWTLPKKEVLLESAS
jgi:MFS transporter, ACS family, hexuronate transporter